MANPEIHGYLLTIIWDRIKAWMLWCKGLADLCLLIHSHLVFAPALEQCEAHREQEIFNDTSKNHDWSFHSSAGVWVQLTQTAWQAGSLACPNQKEFLNRQSDRSHVDRQGLKKSALAG